MFFGIRSEIVFAWIYQTKGLHFVAESPCKKKHYGKPVGINYDCAEKLQFWAKAAKVHFAYYSYMSSEQCDLRAGYKGTRF